jgi:hypothetical protein
MITYSMSGLHTRKAAHWISFGRNPHRESLVKILRVER